MDKYSPQLFLIIAMLANVLVFGLLAWFCKLTNLPAGDRHQLILLSCFGFLANALFLWLASCSTKKSLLRRDAEVKAPLLACLDSGSKSESDLISLPLEKIAQDLTTQVEELRQAERVIVDYSPDLICALDASGQIIELNASAERIWQHPNLSLFGAALTKLSHPDDAQKLNQYLQDLKEGNELKPLECRFISLSGKPVDLSLHAEWSQTGNGYYCVGTDISAAKEIERLRAEISSMVSHDLRAPISALSFFLEGLLSGEFAVLTDAGRAHVLKLKENLQQVLRLINQLLDAEKLDSGGISVDLKVVPIFSVFESVVDLLLPLAERKKIEIEVCQSDLLVFADFDRSVQVVANLLANAIKFSPESSKISLKAESDAGLVKIEVSDQGPGIPVEHWARIFERFKTIDTNKEGSGAGLGLYISKTLIELQGGQMGVYSVPGKGARFWFTLKHATEDDLPGYLS